MRSRGRSLSSRPANLVPARQWSCSVFDAAAIAFLSSIVLIPHQPIMIFVCGPIRRNSRSMADFVIETHPAAGDPWAGVVIDFDDEIVEVVLARQPIAGLITDQANRLIVMAVPRVLAPGVLGPDRPDRQIGPRPRMAVGAPPQLQRVIRAPRGAAVALPLVGKDAAATKCHRHGPAVRRQPAPPRVAGSPVDPNYRQRPITRSCPISD